MPNYIPQDFQDRRGWLVAFLAALPAHGVPVGVLAPEQSTATSVLNAAISGIDNATLKLNEADSAVASRDILLDAANALLRPLVRRIKTNPGYNLTHGEALDIIAPSPAVDPAAIKPTCTLQVMPEFVRLRVRRKGAESVCIYVRRLGETTWTNLGRITRATYEDTRPLAVAGVPEVREYCVHGYLGDDMVGQASDPKVAIFLGPMAA